MAFTLPSTTLVLDFDGTELDGLEVKVRSVSFGRLLEIMELVEAFETGTTVRAQAAAMTQVIDHFAGVLKSWDAVDDDGVPVPATADNLRALDFRHVLILVKAWQEVMTSVPAPLGGSSPGGEPSAVELPPMELASDSLAS